MTLLAISGTVAACVAGFLRLTQAEWFQEALPLRWQWKRLPTATQLRVVWGLTAVGATAGSLASGQAPMEALEIGLGALMAAAGADNQSKKIGAAIDERSMRLDPGYQPGKLREAVSILLPINRALLPRKDPENR